ncbi:hypothetical protein EUX98_g2118 [Antrodiella citrinella]|uniref:Uncharacterized protein n=1 Tax=Antrodiella citrinella TaxID=2447956 RepID=A0A4S4MZU8_9APHY|nr:hypothetical protein EUX98_g2118 [Antrodiella citrinella]
MVSFLAAFSYECFITRDGAAIWSAGAAWIIVGLLIAWCIYSAWEGKDDAWYKRVGETYKRKRHQMAIQLSDIQTIR